MEKKMQEFINSIKLVNEQKIRTISDVEANKYPNNPRRHIRIWISTGAGDVGISVYEDNSISVFSHNGFCYPYITTIERLNKELPLFPSSIEERNRRYESIYNNMVQ